MSYTNETTGNTSEMPMNSVSHKILDKIDNIKQKLTDNEYKEIVDLLQKKHKECNTTMYELYMIVPNISYYKCPCEGECCSGKAELSINTEMLNLKVKILVEDANSIKEEIVKNGRVTFQMNGSHLTYHNNNDKFKSLASAIREDKMFQSYCGISEMRACKKLDKYHHLDFEKREINIIKIKKL